MSLLPWSNIYKATEILDLGGVTSTLAYLLHHGIIYSRQKSFIVQTHNKNSGTLGGYQKDSGKALSFIDRV